VAAIQEAQKDRFREAIALFATGVTVVTTRTDQPVGMTASAVCSLSLDPLQLLVCVSTRLPTHAALMESGRFAVNVLGEGQEPLARRFATSDVDRFEGIAVEDCKGLPLLADAIAHFVCNLQERLPGGDHSIFIGKVTDLGLRHDARPLLYFGSRFGSLARPEDSLLHSWMAEGGV
jgi:flavin reductase (DIM6/NTAB) family NADH-FMN oxidoreductase RutF